MALLLLAVGLAMLPPACAARLMAVSDLHYLDRSLYEDSGLFLRALRAGDGKLTQYSDELLAALREAVRLEAPDALIVTGDLSFNGERKSHEALAARFAQIEADGTPVWVLPGNHDINSAAARAFIGDGWEYVDPVTPAAFADIYADFMLPASGAGLSYCVDIGEDTRVAMTDVAFYQGGAQTFGVFTADHAEWLTRALTEAGAAGATVLTATHHSLLPHTEFSRDSFLMLGSESMQALARAHGVRLNLSGHLHVQHIARSDGLADAALGGFCIWPHRYAIVDTGSGGVSYEARALDPALLPEGLWAYSKNWFYEIARDKAATTLNDLDADKKDAMADYAARFSLAYFAGTYDADDPSWRADPAYEMWCQRGDNVFWQYMAMVMDEPHGDNLRYTSKVK